MNRKIAISVFISILSLTFCAGSVELIARVWESNLAQGPGGWEMLAVRYFKFDWSSEQLLYTFRPNENYSFENVDVYVNSQGLRDVDRDFEKEAGEYRILVLGDSVVFGWELPLEDTLSKQLEALLQEDNLQTNYDVINAGVPGWNLKNQQVFLERIGFDYQPDLIISLVTVQNDLGGEDNCGTYTKPPSTPTGRWLRENVVAVSLISHLRGKFRSDEAEQNVVDVPGAEATYSFSVNRDDRLWEDCVLQPILQMQDHARQAGIDFMLVVSPTDLQVRDFDSPTVPQEIFLEYGVEYGFPVEDLLPTFRDRYNLSSSTSEQDSDNPLYADYYSHHSALGNQLAAQTILETLQDTVKLDVE